MCVPPCMMQHRSIDEHDHYYNYPNLHFAESFSADSTVGGGANADSSNLLPDDCRASCSFACAYSSHARIFICFATKASDGLAFFTPLYYRRNQAVSYRHRHIRMSDVCMHTCAWMNTRIARMNHSHIHHTCVHIADCIILHRARSYTSSHFFSKSGTTRIFLHVCSVFPQWQAPSLLSRQTSSSSCPPADQEPFLSFLCLAPQSFG